MAVGKKELVFAFNIQSGIKTCAQLDSPPHGGLIGGRLGLIAAIEIQTVRIDVVVKLGFKKA